MKLPFIRPTAPFRPLSSPSTGCCPDAVTARSHCALSLSLSLSLSLTCTWSPLSSAANMPRGIGLAAANILSFPIFFASFVDRLFSRRARARARCSHSSAPLRSAPLRSATAEYKRSTRDVGCSSSSVGRRLQSRHERERTSKERKRRRFQMSLGASRWKRTASQQTGNAREEEDSLFLIRGKAGAGKVAGAIFETNG